MDVNEIIILTIYFGGPPRYTKQSTFADNHATRTTPFYYAPTTIYFCGPPRNNYHHGDSVSNMTLVPFWSLPALPDHSNFGRFFLYHLIMHQFLAFSPFLFSRFLYCIQSVPLLEFLVLHSVHSSSRVSCTAPPVPGFRSVPLLEVLVRSSYRFLHFQMALPFLQVWEGVVLYP